MWVPCSSASQIEVEVPVVSEAQPPLLVFDLSQTLARIQKDFECNGIFFE